MKKTIFIFFLFFSINIFSQCTISEIFLFEIGQSKFDITKMISSNNTVGNYGDQNFTNVYEQINCGWRKYDYLKNDSIYNYHYKLKHQKDRCFNGNENIIQLGLADDKLYKISILQEYSKDRYDEMIIYYNNYIDLFKNIYPYSNIIVINNLKTKEKTGEGVSFYSIPKEKRSKVKLEYIEVSYRIEYKLIFNYNKKEYIRTNEVDYYEIEITTVNLKNTKLTNKGY